MAGPSITSKLPNSSTAFIFGSFLSRSDPSDIDVLILYDPLEFKPEYAYRSHASFVGELQRLVALPVDLTLLTYEEEQSSDFIKDTRAIPFEEKLGTELST